MYFVFKLVCFEKLKWYLGKCNHSMMYVDFPQYYISQLCKRQAEIKYLKMTEN